MSIRDRFTALAVVSLLACTAACQSGTDPSPPPAGPRAGDDCIDDRAPFTDVTFGKDVDAELIGIVVGKGKTGVVLAHQSGGDVCQWVPFGEELAERGYTVLLFDFAGSGVSPGSGASLAKQVSSAAAALKARGATTTVLIGASMGGTAVLAAAPALSPPPAAVISYSAPVSFGSTSAVGGISTLTAPVLIAAGRIDGEFARAAETLNQSAPAGKATLLIAEDSGEHGWALVTDGVGSKEVRTKTFEFLDKHAPAK